MVDISARLDADGSPVSLDEIESLEMPDGTWVICDGAGCWLARPDLSNGQAFSRHLLDPGSAAHTRQLLAGAMSAGAESRSSGQDNRSGLAKSLPRYIYDLARVYRLTHATPPIMRRAASRLRAMGDVATSRHLAQAADEEIGHDRLALKDLEELRIRAPEFVDDVRPRLAIEMLALVERLAEGPEPISVLGYVYAVERLSLFITQEQIDAIEALVPTGVMATRCLRVHSAVGTDPRHVTAAVDVIARLSAADRISVCHAAFETMACITSPTEQPGDDAMQELVSRYRG